MDPSDFADILASVRRFVREQVVPREDEIEADDEVPTTLRDACLFGTNNGIAGQVTASFALTEPDAGSDPSSLTTTAVRDGSGDWVVNGAKRWITNAPAADVLMVLARTRGGPGDDAVPPAKGISTFLVPTTTPGVSFGPHHAKMGQRGSWTRAVYLDDVRVPAANLVGGPEGEHRGFVTAMRCLAHGRLHIAALCSRSRANQQVIIARGVLGSAARS